MQRITDTTLLMAQASGAAGLVAATAWPAVLAGLWWGTVLAFTGAAGGRRGRA
jgi:hypothetical protein